MPGDNIQDQDQCDNAYVISQLHSPDQMTYLRISMMQTSLHHIHGQMNQKLQYSNRWDTAILQHQDHVPGLQATQVEHQKTTIQ
ncbi:hypothetical protein DPMN_073840 [Dreissena polymorpha]|uniref:Uncharacterized protein n=1 Tax=Dreissena polymorpha TaxID=45954 RepID=A0A9D4BZZ6_DREPO|nr:hypothetical protein DPMN_073840 [Dreissena polymorpha]